MASPLRAYHAKRDFARTPEPRGKAAKRGKHGFVVQKHAASHLHYDFRLEHAGTLKSWAVPKGPSLDPAVARLAIEVEDHPLEYATFEGTIPKGQYGGGTVIVWDRGTWEPADDPDDGLRKGKLRFRLEGEKLRGEWILVRRNAGAKRPEWILRKLKDDAARVARMPAFVEPELATLVTEPPEGDAWVHEIKLDGYRALCRIAPGKVRFLTRTGQDRTAAFGRLAEAAAALPVDSAVLDGEVVYLKPDGTTDFQALQQALGPGDDSRLYYWVFDLLYLDGNDLRALPLVERKRLLEDVVARAPRSAERVRFSGHVVGNGSDFWKNACRMSLEGIVSKRADSPYRSTRSRDWLKVKCVAREEFVIVGYTDPQGSRTGLGALLLATHDDGKLRFAGKVGTGFDRTTLVDLQKRLRKLGRSTSPLELGRPRVRGVHWVAPKLVAQIAFTERTRDGILRHPSFQGLRDDKPAREVVRERPVPVPREVTSRTPRAPRARSPRRARGRA